jgi:hypothetical protein
MKQTITRDRYRAVQDAQDSWSVIDDDTDLAYLVRGVPMVLLTEDIASALAEVLNDISPMDRTLH